MNIRTFSLSNPFQLHSSWKRGEYPFRFQYSAYFYQPRGSRCRQEGYKVISFGGTNVLMLKHLGSLRTNYITIVLNRSLTTIKIPDMCTPQIGRVIPLLTSTYLHNTFTTHSLKNTHITCGIIKKHPTMC